MVRSFGRRREGGKEGRREGRREGRVTREVAVGRSVRVWLGRWVDPLDEMRSAPPRHEATDTAYRRVPVEMLKKSKPFTCDSNVCKRRMCTCVHA